jgi:hypothetical protein
MKRIFLLMLLAVLAIQIFAQDEKNYDVVLKLNGEEHVGNVTEMDDNIVKFVHKGESLSYTFKKADIMKITFASGRVEIVNGAPEVNEGNSTPGSGLESHHNKIAILPFSYIINKQSAGEEMSYKVQTECYSFLNNHVGELSIQDPITTNALMIKAGINQENIRGYTMGEICNILGVEFLVTGTITQNNTSTSNYSGTSTSGKNEKNKKNTGNIFAATSSTYSSSTQNYQTAMTMNIYTDKNTNIYSKDHTSFWPNDEAYKITLQYMLKRTPIYKK